MATIAALEDVLAARDGLIQQRHGEGVGVPAIALELGVCRRTVRRRLARAGVDLTRPRAPAPTCARAGCTNEARPGSRYCADSCWLKHPRVKPRPCECGCGVVFRPPASRVARGGGRFFDYECWNRWRSGKPQREWKSGRRLAAGRVLRDVERAAQKPRA